MIWDVWSWNVKSQASYLLANRFFLATPNIPTASAYQKLCCHDLGRPWLRRRLCGISSKHWWNLVVNPYLRFQIRSWNLDLPWYLSYVTMWGLFICATCKQLCFVTIRYQVFFGLIFFDYCNNHQFKYFSWAFTIWNCNDVCHVWCGWRDWC